MRDAKHPRAAPPRQRFPFSGVVFYLVGRMVWDDPVAAVAILSIIMLGRLKGIRGDACCDDRPSD